ncbi:MAG: 50S ribosomal protein L6 [Candidatus Eisenbacteria bacterium]|nr:50S ribosomal protein L6 [Candidatus Eisenbacteria bacterium]
MSRVGKSPIPIPKGVTVSVQGASVRVKGPKGELSANIDPRIDAAVEGDALVVTRDGETKAVRSIHGTTRANLANMVAGVSEGFHRNLDIIGVGYSAELKGRTLVMKLGFSHPIEFEPPKGIEIEVPESTRIVVRGVDKRQVGQVAADIRAFRPPEPYKGKGIRYHNEYVRRKAGKLAVSSGF